jgi:hypothetical protein
VLDHGRSSLMANSMGKYGRLYGVIMPCGVSSMKRYGLPPGMPRPIILSLWLIDAGTMVTRY